MNWVCKIWRDGHARIHIWSCKEKKKLIKKDENKTRKRADDFFFYQIICCFDVGIGLLGFFFWTSCHRIVM